MDIGMYVCPYTLFFTFFKKKKTLCPYMNIWRGGTMPSVHLYTDSETYKLYECLQSGEASAIFKRALKEHFLLPESLDALNRMLLEVKEEQQKLSHRAKLIEEKKVKIAEKEKELLQAKKTLEEKTERRLTERTSQFLSWAIEVEELDEEKANELLADFLESQLSIVDFFRQRRTSTTPTTRVESSQ